VILRLTLPFLAPNVQWARLVAWHKSEDAQVAPGDRLCTLAVEEILRRRQKFHPGLIHAIVHSDELTLDEIEYKVGRLEYRMALYSSDIGWMRAACASEGERLEIGGLLGVLATEPDDELVACTAVDASSPVFRVVADLVESPSELESAREGDG
jgi:pyruvate/2-oxoglutarate dehydrogenase complex dihydrolipoamide acyltransferase (E2) component